MSTRILDAALARFERQGLSATTMAELASDAGISRAWLYRNFPNREAIARALAARETQRLVAGLVSAADRKLEPAEQLTRAFVHAVSFLRQNKLLKRIRTTDRAAAGDYVLDGAAPWLQMGVNTLAAALTANGSLRPAKASLVADTFVRLVFSIALVADIGTDFDNPRQLRAYAAQIVPALLA